MLSLCPDDEVWIKPTVHPYIPFRHSKFVPHYMDVHCNRKKWNLTKHPIRRIYAILRQLNSVKDGTQRVSVNWMRTMVCCDRCDSCTIFRYLFTFLSRYKGLCLSQVENWTACSIASFLQLFHNFWKNVSLPTVLNVSSCT